VENYIKLSMIQCLSHGMTLSGHVNILKWFMVVKLIRLCRHVGWLHMSNTLALALRSADRVPYFINL